MNETNEMNETNPNQTYAAEKAPWEKAARRTQTHAVLALIALQEAYDKLEKEHEYHAKVRRDQNETLHRQRDRIDSLSRELADARANAEGWADRSKELKRLLDTTTGQLSRLRKARTTAEQKRWARITAKIRKSRTADKRKKKGAKR